MRTVIVDRDGQTWDAGDRRLYRRFDITADSDASLRLLVRNLGMARVLISQNSCRISVASGRITTMTLLAIGQLIDGDVERVLVSAFDRTWTHEMFGGRDDAMHYLASRMIKDHRRSGSRHLSEQKPIIAEALSGAHRSLLELWKAGQGSIDIEAHAEDLHRMFDGKFVVVCRRPEQGEVTFDYLGGGLDVYLDREWKRYALGANVEYQEDVRYGRWVADSYRDAMLANSPVLLDADVLISDRQKGGCRRKLYTRLSLPIQRSDNEIGLLCASILNSDIDLRSEIGHELEEIVD